MSVEQTMRKLAIRIFTRHKSKSKATLNHALQVSGNHYECGAYIMFLYSCHLRLRNPNHLSLNQARRMFLLVLSDLETN